MPSGDWGNSDMARAWIGPARRLGRLPVDRCGALGRQWSWRHRFDWPARPGLSGASMQRRGRAPTLQSRSLRHPCGRAAPGECAPRCDPPHARRRHDLKTVSGQSDGQSCPKMAQAIEDSGRAPVERAPVTYTVVPSKSLLHTDQCTLLAKLPV
jgi:hypothetical protein